jgi:hypothetical protein
MAMWNNQMVYYGSNRPKNMDRLIHSKYLPIQNLVQARDGDIIVGNGRGGNGS